MIYNKVYISLTTMVLQALEEKITKHWDSFAGHCTFSNFVNMLMSISGFLGNHLESFRTVAAFGALAFNFVVSGVHFKKKIIFRI